MTILLTGGAGYIGSHCFYEFQQQSQDIVVIDNLSTGYGSYFLMMPNFMKATSQIQVS